MAATPATERVAPERELTFSARVARYAGRAPVHLTLIFISVFWIVPTLGLLITSFRPRPDIASSGWWTTLTDFSFTLDNYREMIDQNGMGRAFVNSIIITLPSTLLPLAVGTMAAYAFSWMRFPFRDTLFLIVVALMVVPIQATLVPLLKLFSDWNVTGNYIGIVIAHTTFGLPLAIFLLRNFFVGLPYDLIEAARVDGSTSFGILRRIVVPLSVPALASYGIFQFLWVWNDLLLALIFVQDPDDLPMTIQISNVQSTYGTEWHLLSAGAFLLMIVPLIVFFCLQRYFVQGLLAGSVKG